MGAKPKETVPGDNCALCYPPGETPSEVHCFCGGISTGSLWHPGLPSPPNGYYILNQNPILPCRYDLLTNDFLFDLRWAVGAAELTIEAVGITFVLIGTSVNDCEKYFANDQVEPPPKTYHGGFAYISTMGDIIDKVNNIVPVYEDGARFEVTPGAGEILNIRYANRKHRQNIIVQVPAD